MPRCSLRSTSRALILCISLGLTGQPGVQAAACEDFRSAISEGGEIDASAVSLCNSTATPEMLAELLDMAVSYRQGRIAVEVLKAGSEKLTSPELMHRAAAFEQPRVIELLLQKKPELLEAKNNAGWTPLTSAALGRAYMAASLLLEHGASEDIGQSLEVAVGRSREIAYLIMQWHPNWVADSAVAGDVLGAAIQYTDEPFLQFLLDSGTSPDLKDSYGYFVVLRAVAHDSPRAGQRNWEFMVRHGSDELEAICSLENEKVDHLQVHAADWFKARLSALRPDCPRR